MTIEEFMKDYNLKNQQTVMNWLNQELIKGSYQDKEGVWVIPKRAMPPYTGARAKNADGILVSIVEACIKRRSVCAQLYHISDEEFDEYIEVLVNAQLIRVREDDGIKYYYATDRSKEFVGDHKAIRKVVMEVLKAMFKTMAGGAMNHILSQLFS